jgi:hypothetical protein
VWRALLTFILLVRGPLERVCSLAEHGLPNVVFDVAQNADDFDFALCVLLPEKAELAHAQPDTVAVLCQLLLELLRGVNLVLLVLHHFRKQEAKRRQADLQARSLSGAPCTRQSAPWASPDVQRADGSGEQRGTRGEARAHSARPPRSCPWAARARRGGGEPLCGPSLCERRPLPLGLAHDGQFRFKFVSSPGSCAALKAAEGEAVLSVSHTDTRSMSAHRMRGRAPAWGVPAGCVASAELPGRAMRRAPDCTAAGDLHGARHEAMARTAGDGRTFKRRGCSAGDGHRGASDAAIVAHAAARGLAAARAWHRRTETYEPRRRSAVVDPAALWIALSWMSSICGLQHASASAAASGTISTACPDGQYAVNHSKFSNVTWQHMFARSSSFVPDDVVYRRLLASGTQQNNSTVANTSSICPPNASTSPCRPSEFGCNCSRQCDDLVSCTGHGRCRGKTGECMCDLGWSGAECSQQLPGLGSLPVMLVSPRRCPCLSWLRAPVKFIAPGGTGSRLHSHFFLLSLRLTGTAMHFRRVLLFSPPHRKTRCYGILATTPQEHGWASETAHRSQPSG